MKQMTIIIDRARITYYPSFMVFFIDYLIMFLFVLKAGCVILFRAIPFQVVDHYFSEMFGLNHLFW